MSLFETITNFIIWRFRHNGCFFRRITGLYCPGCGGSRALMFLLRGDLIHSFIYHPALLYILVMLAVFMFQLIYTLITKRKLHLIKPIHGYALIGLILVQWIIKNILLLAGHDILNVSLGSFFR